MKRGRPRKAREESVGRLRMPSSLPPSQRVIWQRLCKRECAASWGSAQTDLLLALVAAIDTHDKAEADLARDGLYVTNAQTGMIHTHPAVGIAERERSLIANLAAKLGMAMNGRIGIRKAKEKAGPGASAFLTMAPTTAKNG